MQLNSITSRNSVLSSPFQFKALPLPGETATEAHCFYVPANMVRPRDYRKNRPDSVNSIDDIASQPFVSLKHKNFSQLHIIIFTIIKT